MAGISGHSLHIDQMPEQLRSVLCVSNTGEESLMKVSDYIDNGELPSRQQHTEQNQVVSLVDCQEMMTLL